MKKAFLKNNNDILTMDQSAGLLMFRHNQDNVLEVFLVHPGGPFWVNIDKWGIPKGKVEEDEDLLQTAIREFQEETGIIVQSLNLISIGTSKTSTKFVHAWAFEFDFTGDIKSNLFEMEYKGEMIQAPEVDKGRYFSIEEAKEKIHKSQIPLLENFLKIYNMNMR